MPSAATTTTTTETKPEAPASQFQQPIPTNQTSEPFENVQPMQSPPTNIPLPPPSPPVVATIQPPIAPQSPPQQEEQNEAPSIDTTGMVCAKDHPDYAPFFKMVKVGVPPFVVQGKMGSLGLNGALLDTPDELIPAP